MNVPALISEVDSTWLKAQQCARHGPVRHFPVHLGLHYTGRVRRYQVRGATSVRLTHKHLLISTAPLAHFGPAFQRLGRSWPPLRAERLLALKQLLAQPTAWNGWWKTKPQFHIKPNPT